MKLKEVEDKVNENKKEITFVKGFYSYEHNSDLVYDCKLNLFKTHIMVYQDGSQKIFMILQLKMCYILLKI